MLMGKWVPGYSGTWVQGWVYGYRVGTGWVHGQIGKLACEVFKGMYSA